MKPCVNGHELISHEGEDCPLCLRDQENFDLNRRIAEFILKVNSLKFEVEKIDKIIAEMKAIIANYGKQPIPQYTDDTTGIREFIKEK